MTVRMSIVALALLLICGVCHGNEKRWSNFGEDTDLKYYLDQQSVLSLPDNVYIFWVKSVAKDKEYFKKEYNLSDLSYIFTNYELDCAISSYRIRGSVMFDKNRRQISKALPAGGEAVFEPVLPESVLELAQNEICVKEELAQKIPVPQGEMAAAPTVPATLEAPVSPQAPEVPEVPLSPEVPEVPVSPQAPVEPLSVQ